MAAATVISNKARSVRIIPLTTKKKCVTSGIFSKDAPARSAATKIAVNIRFVARWREEAITFSISSRYRTLEFRVIAGLHAKFSAIGIRSRRAVTLFQKDLNTHRPAKIKNAANKLENTPNETT